MTWRLDPLNANHIIGLEPAPDIAIYLLSDYLLAQQMTHYMLQRNMQNNNNIPEN